MTRVHAMTASLVCLLVAACSADSESAEPKPDASASETASFDPNACPTIDVPEVADQLGDAAITEASGRRLCDVATPLSTCESSFATTCAAAAHRFSVARAIGTAQEGTIDMACRLTVDDFQGCVTALAGCDVEPAECSTHSCEKAVDVDEWLARPMSDPAALATIGGSLWVQPEVERLCNGALTPPESTPALGCDVQSDQHLDARICQHVAARHFCQCNAADGIDCPEPRSAMAQCLADAPTGGWGSERCAELSGQDAASEALTVFEEARNDTVDARALKEMDIEAARAACRLVLPFGCARRGVEFCALRIQALRLGCAEAGADDAACALTVGDLRQCATVAHPEECLTDLGDEPKFDNRPRLPSCIPLPHRHSGVEPTRKVVDMNATERADFCGWQHRAFGGSSYHPCFCVQRLEPTTVPNTAVCEADLANAFDGCGVTTNDLEVCVRWIAEKGPCRRQGRFGICKETLSWFACHLMLNDDELPEDYHRGVVEDGIGCTPILDCLAGVENIRNGPRD